MKERDNEFSEPYEVDGIIHYIMSNNDTNSVAWVNGVVEGHIQGNLSVEDLKEMVNSIYQG